MKFFYALIVFVLSTYLFFWMNVFIIPTPKLTSAEENTLNVQSSYEEEQVIKALNVVKADDKKNLYHFDKDLDSKRSDAVLLYVLLGFVTMFVMIILTFRKSYILFPVLTSVIVALVASCALWMFTNTIDKNVYLDLQAIRAAYQGFKSLQYLAVFLFLDLFMFAFGMWYDL